MDGHQTAKGSNTQNSISRIQRCYITEPTNLGFHCNYVNGDRAIILKFNPLNAELNPICHLLALLGAHHILHVSRIRVNIPCRYQWPHCLRRRSTAPRLLRFGFESRRGAWMSVCCNCCLLSGRGVCDELITPL
jgi:hypothetical protein